MWSRTHTGWREPAPGDAPAPLRGHRATVASPRREGPTIARPPHLGPATGPAPSELAELRGWIDEQLVGALDELLPPIADRHPTIAPAIDGFRDFLDSGKRIRPALVVLGHRAAGGTDDRDVLGPAIALELLHTCALLHDDVIDQADRRRGRPTMHEAAAARHRDAGWLGDADAYGRAVAILVGDLAFVHADRLFLTTPVPAERVLAGLARFTMLREEVMIGQYLDLQAATERSTERELALEIATLKSGRYSVTRPLELGAVLAGAPQALIDRLRAVGDPLGRAFQLADDLLGVFGDPASTGKSTSSDLAEGKRTLLIAEAAARLDEHDLARLEGALGAADLDEHRIREIRELLTVCGARDAVTATIERETAAAHTALRELPIAAEVRTTLVEVANYLGDRSS